MSTKWVAVKRKRMGEIGRARRKRLQSKREKHMPFLLIPEVYSQYSLSSVDRFRSQFWFFLSLSLLLLLLLLLLIWNFSLISVVGSFFFILLRLSLLSVSLILSCSPASCAFDYRAILSNKVNRVF